MNHLFQGPVGLTGKMGKPGVKGDPGTQGPKGDQVGGQVYSTANFIGFIGSDFAETCNQKHVANMYIVEKCKYVFGTIKMNFLKDKLCNASNKTFSY